MATELFASLTLFATSKKVHVIVKIPKKRIVGKAPCQKYQITRTKNMPENQEGHDFTGRRGGPVNAMTIYIKLSPGVLLLNQMQMGFSCLKLARPCWNLVIFAQKISHEMIVFTPNVTLSSLVIWTTVDFQMPNCVIVCHHEANLWKTIWISYQRGISQL